MHPPEGVNHPRTDVDLGQTRSRVNHILAFDGVRGLAALYVCVHHAYLEVSEDHLPAIVEWLGQRLTYGHEAVALFIVLSGFVLMLPSARTGQVRGGLGSYFWRRARRILPPYYASILLTLLVILAVPRLQSPTGLRWDVLLPATTPGVLASHAFLVHNLSSEWCSKITGTAWSVATEVHIYIVFPLLLFLWKRFGNLATIGTGLALGAFAAANLPEWSLTGWCPWYLGLFAMGMAGATADVSQGRRVSVLIFILAISGYEIHKATRGACYTGPELFRPMVSGPPIWMLWQHDSGVGLMATSLLLAVRWFNNFPQRIWNPIWILGSRPLAMLGLFSYSLYLIHQPLLSIAHLLIHGRGMGPTGELAIMLGVAVPVTLVLSYGFYLLVEKRFTPTVWHSPSSPAIDRTAQP